MSNPGRVDVFESTNNRVLCSLGAEQRDRLSPRPEPVSLNFGVALYEAGDAVDHVFFPNSGLVSLLSTTVLLY